MNSQDADFFEPVPRHIREAGAPFVDIYSPQDYDGFTQNWGMVEDSMGILYFANGDGILIYDGVHWEVVPLPNHGHVKSIAIDHGGRIYAGASGEFGYLECLPNGKRIYVSMVTGLSDGDQDFSTVWRIAVTGEGVFFCSQEALFRFQNDAITVWKEKEFDSVYSIHEQVFVTPWGKGLYQLLNDSITTAMGEAEIDDRILSICEISNRTALLLTSKQGLFFFREGLTWKFPTEIDSLLESRRAYCIAVLRDSSYAVGTLNGLYVIDKVGRLIHNFTIEELVNLQIHNLLVSKSGYLWVALDQGIAKIEVPSPFSQYKEKEKFQRCLAVRRYQDQIYAGTANGLLILKPSPLGNLVFQAVPALQEKIWDLLIFEDRLLVAAETGVFEYVNGNIIEIGDLDPSAFLKSKIDRSRIFVSESSGISSIYRQDNQWVTGDKIDGIMGGIYTMLEQQNGSLWLETSENRVWQIAFSDREEAVTLDNPIISKYEEAKGIDDRGDLHLFDDRVYYITGNTNETLRFDPVADEFVRDQILPGLFDMPDKDILIEAVDSKGNVWFATLHDGESFNRFVAWNNGDDTYQVVDRHESHLSGKIDWSISIIDSVLWLGGIDFITLHDMRSDWQPQPTYPVVINQVTYLEDSLLAAGPYHRTEHRISFEKNRFRFNYAAVQHRDNSLTNYQVRLAGHEDNWSNWTKETQIDYTNLGEGAYSFEVRARNTSNVIGQIARYNFSILPPWHRSWWAYIFYILTGIFGTGMIVRWRSAQLRREKLSLQKIVKERTSELQVRNEQLQAQKQQLAEQADRLQEVDELKSRFFANISHEFRTPLTLIKGPIDQAFKTPDTSLGRHTIKLIKKNADRLLQLVNQMLDLAKVDAGSLRVEPAEGNVFKGLRAAASSFSSMAAQRNLDYQIKIPARSLWTSFDRDKLDKVVYNLLSNAFKFTPDEGSIIFGASYIDEVLSFSVQDSGAGIDPGQLDRIFDRFFQVDSSETREQQGSGIGLALSKELIELMHGDIIVTSTPGKGSCFKVNIPMLEILGTRPKAIVHPDTPTIISDEVVNSPVANLASSIVLIVEDHEDMGNFIAEQLQEDFIINRASNGEVGFEQAVKAIPDLIITDLMMPKMDGIEMTRLLKMDERTSHIPIIMLTAKAGTDNLIRGIETGADNYLTKPFNADELQARVKNLIRQRTLLREHYAKSTVFNPKEIEVPSRDEVFLQKIQDLLELQHDDPSFGVPIMQKELALSKTQLHRKVKALTNRTPGELLRIFRIQRAMQLLTQSGENVSSVSYQVGFNDPSYFAKVFKDVQGVTPSQFVKDTISK